jgi:hypothetical protein
VRIEEAVHIEEAGRIEENRMITQAVRRVRAAPAGTLEVNLR